jgi:ArsR family transcriptional regulator
MDNTIDIVEVLKAIADETRYAIFKMLLECELCACDVLEAFSITQPTLSFHMKKLTSSGLIVGRKEGIWMRYSVNPVVLKELKDVFNVEACDSLGGKCCQDNVVQLNVQK